MSVKRYKKPIILFIITFSFFCVLSIIAIIFNIGAQTTKYVKIIRFDNTGHWLLYSFSMVVLSAIIGGFLGGYLLGPIFLYIHKVTIGRKMKYGIELQERSEKFNSTFKPLFPAFFSINLALMLVINEDIVNNFVYIEQAGGEGVLITLGILICITVGISTFLFSSVWFLIDAGIVYSNTEKVNNKQDLVVIRSVGGWYSFFLQGFAGIGLGFSFYVFIITMIQKGLLKGQELPLFLILPLIITILSIPAVILLDITFEKRTKYILKWAKKFGIIKNVKISFEEI
jgi:hypothetical protein